MADFTQIIQEINDDINTNGVGAITGAKLNEVLRDMIAAVNAEKQDKLTIYTEDVENERAEINTSLFTVNAEFMRVLCGFFSFYFSDETGLEVTTTSNSCSFKFNSEEFVVKYEDKWLLSFSKTGFRVQLHDGEDPYAMTFDINNGLSFGGVNIGVQLDSLQQNKQDVISDLATIRSGASAGATAYQKPSGGIPKTDLASGVQTSLGKADTAVQQVTVGTTTTGNAGTNASVTNSGTATAPVLNFTIPRGSDGQDGADAVNPFKGWWPDLATLKAAHTAIAGDSAYVKDASPSTTWSIYVYDSTASYNNYWADSGTDADTSNVQTFASGEEVNEVHIVNDLTTGGVDDVLSAEQGKVIDYRFSPLEQIVDIERSQSTNLLDLSLVTDGYYWWIYGAQANSALFYSARIPVIPGETYTLQRTTSSSRVIVSIRMIVGYKEDDTRATNGAFENVNSYVAPQDCAYVIITHYISEKPYELAFVKSSEVIPYEEYGTIVKTSLVDNIVKEENLASESVTVEKLGEDILVVGNNLFDASGVTYDAYIRYTNGSVATNQPGWWCSDYIKLKPNTTYSISSIRDCAFYDSNKEYISGFTATEYNYTFTTDENTYYLRFSGHTPSSPSNVMLNEGNYVLPYEPYSKTISEDLLPKTTEVVKICLPDKIYAVVGDTLQLFVRSIVQAVNPYIYDVLITCQVGQRFPRYYQLNPTSPGEYTLSVQVKDNNNNVLGVKSCQLIVKEAVAQPSSPKKVLFIGDSLTAAGAYTTEAYRRLCGSGGTPAGLGFSNISFVGRKHYGGDVYAEGNVGWSWSDYLTAGRRALTFTVTAVTQVPSVGALYKDANNKEYTMWWDYSSTSLKFFNKSDTPPASGTLTKVSGDGDQTINYTSFVESSANPFWNDSTQQLDITSYIDKWCGGGVDVVYTLLTWNGVSGNVTDFTQFIDYAKELYRAIHTAYPSAVIKMMAVQLPDLRQGEKILGSPISNWYTDMNGLVRTAFNMNDAYQEFANSSEFSSYVEFVNIASQFDSEYNMPYTEVAVNTRNSSVTEKVGTNDVHPSTNGYYQIADVVFRNFVANFCQ